MQVSWNTNERIAALAILNGLTGASMKEWRSVKLARKALDFSDKEKAELEMKVPPNGQGLMWNQEKGEKEKKFELDELVINLIGRILDQLDKAGNVHPDLVPLAEKIIIVPESEAEEGETK